MKCFCRFLCATLWLQSIVINLECISLNGWMPPYQTLSQVHLWLILIWLQYKLPLYVSLTSSLRSPRLDGIFWLLWRGCHFGEVIICLNKNKSGQENTNIVKKWVYILEGWPLVEVPLLSNWIVNHAATKSWLLPLMQVNNAALNILQHIYLSKKKKKKWKTLSWVAVKLIWRHRCSRISRPW